MNQIATLSAKCGVALGPVLPEHLPLMFRWRNSITELFLWNGERNFIDPEGFKSELQALSERVMDSAIILAPDGIPAGFIYAEPKGIYRTGTSVGLYVAPEYRRREIAAAGFGLFANHLFFDHNLGKIKVAVAEWNLGSMGLVTRFSDVLHSEGTMESELLLDGKTWNLHNFAIFREDFQKKIKKSALWKRLIGQEYDDAVEKTPYSLPRQANRDNWSIT
ncbi:MAG: GNAT family N-acetyltransferase [Fimbriimonadaceae bacterium]|nr:GNAT family N-acetyltransferase [Fimbriimonadaceae bacterium]